MKIKHIELRDFKSFAFSNIKTITIDTEEPIQIVVGQSGAGKSRLLQEIIPTAALKPNYGRKGYKKLVIEHNESLYELISDFSNKGKPHSFIKDGEELNVGGTGVVQNELSERYFSYTNLVKSILYFSVKMCEMSKGERKALILNINPTDLSLVIDKHKYVCSKIRECKNNLTLLYRRKQEIEAKMLNKYVLEEKYKLKDDLNKQLQELSKDEYYLNHQISMIKIDNSVNNKVNDIYTIISDCEPRGNKMLFIRQTLGLDQLEKDINLLSARHRYLDKDDYPERKVELACILSEKERKERELQMSVYKLLQEMENANKHLREINLTQDAGILEKTLKELEQEYTEYSSLEEPKVRIEEDNYSSHVEFKNRLTQHLSNFTNLHIRKKIIDENKLYLCKKKLSEIQQNKCNTLSSIQSKCKQTIKEIDDELKMLPNDPPEIVETCKICDYRSIYVTQATRLKKKREQLVLEEVNAFKWYSIWDKTCKVLAKFIHDQDLAYEIINKLYQELDKTSFRISKQSLIKRLNEDPAKFENTIISIIDNYPKIYKKRKLEQEINKLKQQLEIMEKTNLPSVKFVKEIIDKCQKEIDSTNRELSELKRSINKTEYQLSGYVKYGELQQKCLDISNHIHEAYQYISMQASRMFYTMELDRVLIEKNKIIFKLKDLEQELKEQESLLARYNEETLKLISEIEQDKQTYEEIEFGLSPSTGFPHKNIVEYLNVLINNVNCILNSLTTYPLEIVSLSVDDPLDYTFKCRADDVELNDISNLSTGQRLRVNLAFVLAFILDMGITNYPICLDEVIMGLDPTHTRLILEWLNDLVKEKYVSQMFFVNHDVMMSSGFDKYDVICLSDDNITPPDNYNEHVKIN